MTNSGNPDTSLLREAAIGAFFAVLQDAWSGADESLGDLYLPGSVLSAYSRSRMDGPLSALEKPLTGMLEACRQSYKAGPSHSSPEAWTLALALKTIEGLIPLPSYRKAGDRREDGNSQHGAEHLEFSKWLIEPGGTFSRTCVLPKFPILARRQGAFCEVAILLAPDFERAATEKVKQLIAEWEQTEPSEPAPRQVGFTS